MQGRAATEELIKDIHLLTGNGDIGFAPNVHKEKKQSKTEKKTLHQSCISCVITKGGKNHERKLFF